MRVVHDGSEPWFDGHFPGAPVLPAVAQLDAVDRLLGEEGLALRGIEQARFRRAIVPGETAEISLEPADSPDRRRFAVRVGERVAGDGLVRIGARGGDDPGAFDAVEPPEASSPDVESLIPHRGAMRLIERVLDRGVSVRCLARIGARHGIAGLAPAVLALEAIAQAGAVAGGPVRGYLVGIADAAIAWSAIPVGLPLLVRAIPMPGAPPLAFFEGRVEAGEIEVARARVSVMVTSRGA